jgi:D-beta-D-heptose 7-phosphate kinase/D-beta-D-heptose 1-phosphate adenosyltransferase
LEFPSLSNIHVVVVGDVMLDRYWHGSADRVSPEAPVPVVQVKQTEARPGGAANVALNVVSLGARCTLVGLIGADDAGVELTQRLEAAGVVCDLVTVDDWPTIVKLRMIAQKQQLLRADFEEEIPQTGASERIAQLQNRVEKHLQSASLLVIEDYDKGAIEEPQGLIYAAQRRAVGVLVDPKLKPFAQYRGANVIKPNEKEFVHAVGKIKDLSAQAGQLITELGLDGIVLTRGGEGMDVLTGKTDHHIPARPVEVFDVTGAGDTTAATLAVGMALDWPLVDCARIANVAASLAVAKLGTAPVSGPELRAALARASADRGVLQREQLAQAVADARHNGEKVVFTNGCFDILHAGHVTYLEEAAALGDRLVVAINDDASVTRLKGPGRPVVPVESRGRVLAGLGCVDWVVSFAEDTPESLLKLLQPDVLVKGGDYSPAEVVGGDLVRAYGGEVRVLSLVSDISTSAIVEKIKKA